MVKVKKVTRDLNDDEYEAVKRLNCQLTGETREVRRSPYAGGTMFLAEDGGIVGMLTLCIYDAPSGKKAWIEDFVVDATYRGSGTGKMLMDSAVELAKSEGADKLMLTSRPSRQAAHRFYERYGFALRETDVFTLSLL